MARPVGESEPMGDGARWAVSVGVFFLTVFGVGFLLLLALLALSPNLGPIELGLIALIGFAVAFPVARRVYRKLAR